MRVDWRGRRAVALTLVLSIVLTPLLSPAPVALADDQPGVFQPPQLAACPPNGGPNGQLQADGWHAAGVHCSMAGVPYDFPVRNVTVGNLWVDQVWFDPQSPGTYPPNPTVAVCFRFYVHEVPEVAGANGGPNMGLFIVKSENSVGAIAQFNNTAVTIGRVAPVGGSGWYVFYSITRPDNLVAVGRFGANTAFGNYVGHDEGMTPAVWQMNQTAPGRLPPGVGAAEVAVGSLPIPDVNAAAYHTSCAAYGVGAPLDFGAGHSDTTFGAGLYQATSKDPVTLSTGSFTVHASDLSLPGRLLPLDFARWYNSADPTAGPLGRGWTHTFNWSLTDSGAAVTVRHGDGRTDTFTRNADGTYRDPPSIFDTFAKNADGTFTLTLTAQTQYEFSSAGRLTRIHEPAGNQIALSYVGSNLSTITDTVGRAVSLSYDAANRLTQIQDPIGRTLTYAYDASGRLATVTDKIGTAAGQTPAQHQWRYAYDGASSHITTITDPDGRVRVTNAYDTQGRVIQQRDGLGALTTFAYSTGQTVSTDPRGHATTYTFDSLLRQLTQSDVVGATTLILSYSYDAAGNRRSVTDRRGFTTDFSYDPRGNLLTKTDPPIGTNPRTVTAYQYDPKNNLTQITDPRGFTTVMSYDPATNLLQSVTRQIDATTSAVTKYQYTDPVNAGLPTRIISPRGNTTPTPDLTYATTLGYDTQGNLVSRTDADGAVTTYTPDGVGRITSRVDPDGNATGAVAAEHSWLTAFDENDRVTSETDPRGRPTQYGYDGAGNRTSLTDRSGNLTRYTYDANARLRTVQQQPDPLGQPTLTYTTTVNRDPNGNAIQIVQANGVTTDYGFDELDRLSSTTTHPTPTLALTASYTLDGNGNATTHTSGDGVAVTNVYDPLNRLSSVAATGIALAFQYDAAGNRTQLSDGTGTTTYQYDGLGRMKQAAAPGGTLGYGYDLDSNRTTLSYPGAATVSYGYSPGGRLSTVTDWAARQTSYSYTPAGLARTVTLPASLGGLTTTYAYDAAQRLSSVRNTAGTAVVSSHAYTLDDEGNRTALDEYVAGLTAPGAGSWSRVSGAVLAASTAAPPTAAPLTWNAGPLGAPLAAQDKLIAVVVTSTSAPAAVSTSALSDSLGNTWVRDTTPLTFADGASSAEMSVWSAVSAAGTPGSITLSFASAFSATGASAAIAVAAYRGLLPQAGPAGVDVARLASGVGSGTNAADSGTTLFGTAAANELKLGLYADQGAAPQPLSPGTLDTPYALSVSLDSSAQGQVLIEDASSGPAASTARATASLLGVGSPHWGMGVFVYKRAQSGLDRFDLSYDGLQRLVDVTAATNPESFTLDGASNITGRTGPAATYGIDGANRPTGDGTSAFVWSNADRLTGRGADSFAYDPLGRMTSSTVAAATRTYTYNGDGLLASATTGTTTTSYLWDPSRAPAPLLQQGTTRIVYGLGPLYADSAGATTAFARDGLGSIRAEVSASGAATNAFRYAAYGRLVQSLAGAPASLGYAGELGDPSGLVYLRARWYDPGMGRFMTSDPLGGSGESPSSLNLYSYASANPIRFLDPTGLSTEPWWAKALLDDFLAAAAAGIAAAIPNRGVQWRFEGVYGRTWGIEEWIGPDPIKPAAKVALEGAHKVGFWAGLAQGASDALFHPELSVGQRFGRAGVAAAVGVTAVAITAVVLAPFALTGGAAVLATVGGATLVGILIDEAVVKPKIYPAFGFGR